METIVQRSSCLSRGVGQNRSDHSYWYKNVILSLLWSIQNPTRVFTNNIIIRFHPGLEIEGDEVNYKTPSHWLPLLSGLPSHQVITVICRYPPPVVQPPLVPELLQ